MGFRRPSLDQRNGLLALFTNSNLILFNVFKLSVPLFYMQQEPYTRFRQPEQSSWELIATCSLWVDFFIVGREQNEGEAIFSPTLGPARLANGELKDALLLPPPLPTKLVFMRMCSNITKDTIDTWSGKSSRKLYYLVHTKGCRLLRCTQTNWGIMLENTLLQIFRGLTARIFRANSIKLWRHSRRAHSRHTDHPVTILHVETRTHFISLRSSHHLLRQHPLG